MGVIAKTYEITGRTDTISIVMIVQTLPILFFGFFGGVLADRFNKRRLMAGADIYCMLISIIFIFANSTITIATLAGLLIIGTVIFKPARDASIPELTTRELLPEANALFGINKGISFFIGSAIAGMMIKTISVNACFIFNAVSFLGSAALVLSIPRNKFSTRAHDFNKKTSVLADFRITKEVIFNNRILLGTIFLLAAFMVEISIVNPLLPKFTKDFLNRPAEDFGFILSCIGLGGVLGAPAIPVFAKKIELKTLIFLASLLHGLMMLLLLTTSNFYTALGFVTIIGFFGMGVGVCGQILIQTEGEKMHLGKIFATNGAISSLATVIGLSIGGIIGETLPVEQAWLISGVFGITYPVLGIYIMKES